MDPRQIIKQIMALCSHLAQVAAGAPQRNVEATREKQEEKSAVHPEDNRQQQVKKRSVVETAMTPQRPPIKQQKKLKKQSFDVVDKGIVETPKKKRLVPVERSPDMWKRLQSLPGRTAGEAVGGKANGAERQFRKTVEGKVVHVVREEEVCADHELVLSEWQDYEAMLCAKCQETFERGGFSPTSLCSWRCGIHDVDVCLRCIPVVMEA